MPNAAAKYSTEYLTTEQMATGLRKTHSVLLDIFGECIFTAYYGTRAKIHGDLQYKPMRVGTDLLQWFVEDSIEQGIILPGESDLLLSSPHEELKLVFCHECDIHVDGSSSELMEKFMASAPFDSYRWYSHHEVEAEMGRDRRE